MFRSGAKNCSKKFFLQMKSKNLHQFYLSCLHHTVLKFEWYQYLLHHDEWTIKQHIRYFAEARLLMCDTFRVKIVCIYMLTLYFKLTLNVNTVFYSCFNVTTNPTRFFWLPSTLHSLVRNIFESMFRDIWPFTRL